MEVSRRLTCVSIALRTSAYGTKAGANGDHVIVMDEPANRMMSAGDPKQTLGF